MFEVSSENFPNKLYFSALYKTDLFKQKIIVGLSKLNNVLTVNFNIVMDYQEWENPFKANDFVDELVKHLNNLGFKTEKYYESDDNILEIDVEMVLESNSISNEIDNFAKVIKSEYLKIESEFLRDTSENFLTKIFEFPEEYEYICSQYLMWFGELLKELNIDAHISVKNRRNLTLLTIDSKDSSELKQEIEKIL